MNKTDNILRNKKCLKLICAAGNENIKEVEALSYVYSCSGFNMIDTAAKREVIQAAKNGIKRAEKSDTAAICVSIGLQSDIHFSKAAINRTKCDVCENCINQCEQNAIFKEDEKIYIDEKKCIGCSNCIDFCPNGAIIKEHKYKSPCEMLLNILSEDIDCIEFHCTSDNENLILETYSQIKSIYKGHTGICMDRSKMGDDKIISLIKKMAQNNDNFIIQADGKPMSGKNDDYNSNIQTIAFADLIRKNNIPAFLIASGGTNTKTSEFAKLSGVDINGVSIGSFARKLVKEETSNPNFFENKALQETAIAKAKQLADSILKYL